MELCLLFSLSEVFSPGEKLALVTVWEEAHMTGNEGCGLGCRRTTKGCFTAVLDI
jgi:hypothetical protein